MSWWAIPMAVIIGITLLATALLIAVAVRIWRGLKVGEDDGSLLQPAEESPQETPAERMTGAFGVIGWILFAVLVAVGGALVYFKPPVGIAILGLAFIYLGTNLHEVRSPNVAFLFRMGKMIGHIDAGWYLTIPHFWTIETISRETVELHLPGQEMYTKAKRPITLHIRVFYRVAELGKALLTRNVINNRVRAVVLAKLKGKVGGKQFSDLLEERGELEEQIRDVVSEELKPDGYEVTGIEIEDLDENVESRAEVIREIGKARGDAARALAEPLKDNYPAAVVSALGSLTEAAERIVSSIWRRQATPAQPTSPERSEGGGVAQQLTEVAREITGRRR